MSGTAAMAIGEAQAAVVSRSLCDRPDLRGRCRVWRQRGRTQRDISPTRISLRKSGGGGGMEMIPFRRRLEDDSMRQASLIEALIDPRLGSNERLSKIDALIDWSPIEAIVRKLRTGAQGRPPYTALKMAKALYLQALYDLSDPGLEAALLDRLSFRRFCGLSLDASTPDETTILRFRHDAAEA